MATRAAAKRKRGSAPVSPPSDGRAARRARGSGGGASAAAAAEQEEPPTLVDVEGKWVEPMKAPREAGQFIDITLLAGGRRIEAHRNVLVGLSPYLYGLLTSGLADESTRWTSTAESLRVKLGGITGATFVSSAFVAYAGPFTAQYRRQLVDA